MDSTFAMLVDGDRTGYVNGTPDTCTAPSRIQESVAARSELYQDYGGEIIPQ